MVIAKDLVQDFEYYLHQGWSASRFKDKTVHLVSLLDESNCTRYYANVVAWQTIRQHSNQEIFKH
eukprot:3940297-Rhodomonas_salina.2